jgi:hypothetical protein
MGNANAAGTAGMRSSLKPQFGALDVEVILKELTVGTFLHPSINFISFTILCPSEIVYQTLYAVAMDDPGEQRAQDRQNLRDTAKIR